jgi:hydroxypyruvate reductase
MNAGAPALEHTLGAAFRQALTDLDPSVRVEQALPPLPPRHARVRVIAAGKAAAAMARGAVAKWGDRIEDVLVVTVGVGQSAPVETPIPGRTTWLSAAHPIPDERGAAAALQALGRARDLGSKDLLLALISGGTSALLSLPPEGLDLARKADLVARLLEAGAPIQDVNLVRRHLSRIKGGRLALAAAPARVLTLIASDVIEGKPHDIGSGPTVSDPTDIEQARRILMQHAPDLAQATLIHLSESLKPEARAVRQRARILMAPDDLAHAVAARLEQAGLRAQALPADQGDATSIAQHRVQIAHRLQPGEAVTIACEPTIRLPATRGRGGRAGWVALHAMRHLPDDVVLLCGASDGVDGNGGGAGAVVRLVNARAAGSAAIDAALDAFDDAVLHRRLGTTLELSPTGHNLTDLHIVARQA